MNRITESNLQYLVDRINKITGSPMTPYVMSVVQLGNYHLDYSYGGVALYRVSNKAGGVEDVFGSGQVPKRELFGLLRAFLEGCKAHHN
jgi:hypothetical protein